MILSAELTLAILVGFVMAWAVGANDVANAMASTVGSKT
jgi:PiT family inorganic phosphate transporter